MKTKIVHAVPNVDLPLPCRKAELPYFVFNSRGINISFLWIALITHWTSCPLVHHVPEHPGPIVSHSFANSHYLHNILYFFDLNGQSQIFPHIIHQIFAHYVPLPSRFQVFTTYFATRLCIISFIRIIENSWKPRSPLNLTLSKVFIPEACHWFWFFFCIGSESIS